jgi:two-component system, cell cycle sensor histidine kinase and response regulator CckA
MPEADMKEEKRGDAGARGELRARRERIAQTMLDVLLPVGATFTVCLPEVEPLPPAAEADPAEAASPGSGTVLLVEDHPSVRALARRILERNGYRVREAATGGEALQLCEGYDGPLDLLLTDVVMPRMSGRELAERLQEIRPGLPVLFMSGYAEDEIAHRGVLEPGTHFIEKPFSPEAFARKVQEVLAAARRGPPPHPGGRAVTLRP